MRLASFAYAFSMALAIILIHLTTQEKSPLLFVIASALIAIIWFNIINYRRLLHLYRVAYQQLRSVLIINLIIAIQWMATFYGAKYAIPFRLLLVGFIIPVIFSNLVLTKQNKKQWFYFFINLLLTIFIILTMHNLVGIICAILAGSLSYCYRKYCFSIMHKKIFSKLDILCLRNYGLLLIALLAYCLYRVPLTMTWSVIPVLITIPLLTFVLPIYFNQLGINNSGSERHSVIASLTPTIAIILSLLFGIENVSTLSLIIAFIAGIVLILQNLRW